MRYSILSLMLIVNTSIFSQSMLPDEQLISCLTCLDRMVTFSGQRFELPSEDEAYLVKKMMIIGDVRNGRLTNIREVSFGFKSGIIQNDENLLSDLQGDCTKPVFFDKDIANSEALKIVRVYAYFLEGPNQIFSWNQMMQASQDAYGEEVQAVVDSLKNNAQVADVSNTLISVGYPRY